jgi:hypothetical protein
LGINLLLIYKTRLKNIYISKPKKKTIKAKYWNQIKNKQLQFYATGFHGLRLLDFCKTSLASFKKFKSLNLDQ